MEKLLILYISDREKMESFDLYEIINKLKTIHVLRSQRHCVKYPICIHVMA